MKLVRARHRAIADRKEPVPMCSRVTCIALQTHVLGQGVPSEKTGSHTIMIQYRVGHNLWRRGLDHHWQNLSKVATKQNNLSSERLISFTKVSEQAVHAIQSSREKVFVSILLYNKPVEME